MNMCLSNCFILFFFFIENCWRMISWRLGLKLLNRRRWRGVNVWSSRERTSPHQPRLFLTLSSVTTVFSLQLLICLFPRAHLWISVLTNSTSRFYRQWTLPQSWVKFPVWSPVSWPSRTSSVWTVVVMKRKKWSPNYLLLISEMVKCLKL